MTSVLKKKISNIDIPEEKARESISSNQMPERMVNAMMELNYIIKQGWTATYSEDYKNITGTEYTGAKEFFENNLNAIN